MFELLNVNKPGGVSSRDVVDHVQRLVRPHKAGHAGTLDPLATGVLVVCLGRATRLISYVQQQPKEYLAGFLLGYSSVTDDVEGTLRQQADSPRPSWQQLEQVLPRFLGRIQQQPPAYSALKVRGRRAYELARSGVDVQLPSRPVQVHQLELLDYQYPRVQLKIRCGSGTYVRALGRDMAQALGTCAVMESLVRRAIGEFHIEQAATVEQLTAESLGAWLLPARTAVAHLPQVELSETEVKRVIRGQLLERPTHGCSGELSACDASGRLWAILAPASRGGLRPVRVFSGSS